MKCAYHNNVDAVATCKTCGVGLCSTCARTISPPQCISCYRDNLVNRKKEVKNSLVKEAVFAAMALVVGLIFMTRGGVPLGEIWGSVLLCAGIPMGWNFLNKITPNIFLFLPWIGWLIYFAAKALLSMMVGIFVAPYVVWKKIREMKQLQQAIGNTAGVYN